MGLATSRPRPRLAKLIGRECGDHCRIAILDRARPKAQI
jgi:hypothetical protein